MPGSGGTPGAVFAAGGAAGFASGSFGGGTSSGGTGGGSPTAANEPGPSATRGPGAGASGAVGGSGRGPPGTCGSAGIAGTTAAAGFTAGSGLAAGGAADDRVQTAGSSLGSSSGSRWIRESSVASRSSVAADWPSSTCSGCSQPVTRPTPSWLFASSDSRWAQRRCTCQSWDGLFCPESLASCQRSS